MSPENLIPVGVAVIFLGFFIVLIGVLMGTKGLKVEWAFGGFIGPVPFGFASKKEWLKFIIVLSLIFLLVFVLLNRRGLGL